MAADLRRKKQGQPTRTGMGQEQLADFVRKPKPTKPRG
jgi:hypothetical protein